MRISDWSSDVCSAQLTKCTFDMEKGLLPDGAVMTNAHEYPASYPQGQQRRATITHERQRHTHDRQHAGYHADVHEDIDKEHHCHRAGQQAAELRMRPRG